METKIAKTISVIFHPLLFPSYLIFIIFNLNHYISLIIPADARLIIFALVFATTFIFPAIFILIFKRKGLITSLHMESREERIYPFIIAGIFNFSTFYMLKQIQLSDIYSLLFLGSSVLIIICLVINFFTKISAHLAGAGGCAGALIGISWRLNIDLVLPILSVIFISGLIGYARLKLQAHKSVEVYTGFTVGMAVMTLFLLI
jgi:hypothetical protein